MTSRNATQVTRMEVPVACVPDALHVGFRQEWISAESGDTQATLFTGAGLGSPFLTLQVKQSETTIYETIDVTDFLEHWITQAIERAEGAAT